MRLLGQHAPRECDMPLPQLLIAASSFTPRCLPKAFANGCMPDPSDIMTYRKDLALRHVRSDFRGYELGQTVPAEGPRNAAVVRPCCPPCDPAARTGRAHLFNGNRDAALNDAEDEDG